MSKSKSKRKTRNRLCVCLPDLHVPDHDAPALAWALKTTRELDPYKVIILGDLVDFKSISRFPKPPKDSMTFPYEKRAGRAIVRQLDTEFEGREVVYILGNHCVRLSKYLWRHAPELSDLGELALTELLEIPERWEVVPYNGIYLEQKVLCQHGKKFSKNVLNSNLSEFGCSSVQGHSHRLGIIHRRFPDGRIVSAAECGTLQRFDVGYCATVNWAQGLGVIENGNVRIIRREGA